MLNAWELSCIYGDTRELLSFLATFADPVKNLPTVMAQAGVEKFVIEGVAIRSSKISEDLRSIGGEL